MIRNSYFYKTRILNSRNAFSRERKSGGNIGKVKDVRKSYISFCASGALKTGKYYIPEQTGNHSTETFK